MKEDRSGEISYCGLFCGACFIRQDTLADEAQALLKKLRTFGFEKWGPGLAGMKKEMAAFAHAEICCRVLEAWDHMRCARACKEGGGSQSCPIRRCCVERSLAGCWECESAETCETLAWLKPVNGNINLSNIRRIREVGTDRFIEEMKATGQPFFA